MKNIYLIMDTLIYWDKFDFEKFRQIPQQKRKKGNPGTRSKIRYKDIITAFDIETTRIKEIEQSIMYIWQWCFDDTVVYGRTWQEFLDFCEMLCKCLGENERIFCGVHNLSYEFQFLRGIYDFKPEDVFCMDARKIAKCVLFDKIEMRCTYIHSNSSLKEYTKKYNVKHAKLSGDDFNYYIDRYPWTELTPEELQYCINDVLGLVEAIKAEMQHDGDNIYTFPLTQTGYIRRAAKRAMKLVSHLWVKKQLPTFHIYTMLREAFRGGNTHANRYIAGQIVENVHQVDRSSSYPDVLVNHMYPCDKFYEIGHCSPQKFRELYTRQRAIIMRVYIRGLRLRYPWEGCPYLSRDKCRDIIGGVYDNGRILEAAELCTTICDIDYRIIEKMYIWDSIDYYDVAYTRYGWLPDPFRDLINYYYHEKTALKNVPGEELNYFKAKAHINSLYGMCATDPIKDVLLFKDGEYIPEGTPPEELLQKDNARRQLPNYQVGVWCTAWARYELQKCINIVERSDDAYFVYTDTDSVKYCGDADFTDYNNEKIAASTKNGAYAQDPEGITHYMGVFEDEGTARRFVSLGAKKYAYEDAKGDLHLTVAGVIKKAGAKELAEHGGLEAFKPAFIFTDAGGLEAVYNDDPEIKTYNIDGHDIDITSNVVLRPSTYTLGITSEYERLLYISQLESDIF